MMRFLARTALIAAWLGVTFLATFTGVLWLWVSVFVATGFLTGWVVSSWWAALAPLAAGIVLALIYAPGADDGREMTPGIVLWLICMFVVPALEAVLLAGVGARKIWRAM